MTDLDMKLDNWRNLLLDLGRRNRLIHYPAALPGQRPSRVALAITEPDAMTLWREFVEDERAIKFPMPREDQSGPPTGEKAGDQTAPLDWDQAGPLTEAPAIDAPPTETPAADGSITNQSVAETQKTLRNLRQKARTHIEETGINVLYLAFGFITWHDLVENHDCRSPLLLVPARLSQADLFSPYLLSRLDEEVTGNYALAQKLSQDYKVTLPEYDDEADLSQYIEQVQAACAQMGCRVDAAVELSLFNFSKLSMYQDLGINRDKIVGHPVVRAIAGDASQLNLGLASQGQTRFDHDAVPPAMVFSVLDGDSSQQDAVQLAKDGASFVLQGPPGTGKSQTIANIIAEFLAEGKRVLFVSEKMAALEVVHRRLAQAGLGDFCLTLHRHNSARREVLDQLAVSLGLARGSIALGQEAIVQLAELTRERAGLNSYARELHQAVQPLGCSVYTANARLASLGSVPDVWFDPPDVMNLTLEGMSDQTAVMQQLARMIGEWGYQADNPWWGTAISAATNQLHQQLAQAASQVAVSWEQLQARFAMTGCLYLQDLSLNDLGRYAQLYQLFAQMTASRGQIANEYIDTVLSINGEALLARCTSQYTGLLKAFTREYQADRTLIAQSRHDRQKPTLQQMQQLALSLTAYQALFGQSQALQAGLAQTSTAPLPEALEPVPLEQASLAYQELQAPLLWFTGLFDDPHTLQELPLKALAQRLADCAAKPADLEHYIDYASTVRQAAGFGAYRFVSQAAALGLPAQLIVPAFEKCLSKAWLEAASSQLPAVSAFRRISHDALVESFRRLDLAHLEIAQGALQARLVSHLPEIGSVFSQYDEVGKLQRELAKKRKLMPTRRLFSELHTLLPVLKPCMMMSPLSVSTYLSGSDISFDIVLFDEASQIRTEDAVSAIFRAKQAIVVGDSRQLPPSDFFQASLMGSGDGDADEDEPTDDGAFESLLDESAMLPAQDLLWHYRSRHESLIAFSNAKLYMGRLVTFPSALESAPDLGVEYVLVPDALYQRGERRNPAEAAKVAELAFEHFTAHPDRSLGIIAFGEGQQTAIEDALAAKRQQNPAFEHWFADDSDEPVFIKNLETVQGDERDTVIFSIGYGYDNAGRFPMTFGPLSREGGERRLNVAITRGRINVKLVGSILPHDIDASRVSYQGPKLLREYIDYAMNGVKVIEGGGAAGSSAAGSGGGSSAAGSSGGTGSGSGAAAATSASSPAQPTGLSATFEQAVAGFLRSQGITVEQDVGCSGYRIDLGIRHPEHPDSYCIGIECDGMAYASARTARDRDRTRTAVLEGMGWTIYRVWSTAWVRDPSGEGQRLLDAINQAIGSYQQMTVRGARQAHPQPQPPNEPPDQASPMPRDNQAAAELGPAGQGLPSTTYYRRPADQVPLSDYERVMTEIVAQGFGLDRPGLFKLTAACYGWQRQGPVINKQLESVFERLVRSGRLIEEGGRVSLAE